MNQKTKITSYVMNQLGLEISPKNIRLQTKNWWRSIRQKPKGGLWLTEIGFDALTRAEIKSYKVKFDQPIYTFENKFIIWLDNTIDCPFYLTQKEIFLFGERTAVQLVLFSGNLKLWQNANTRNKEKLVDTP